ncbi:MAG: glycosyltransferase family 2 protein [Planctomycetes bacterium]|nr:glycosyltransferase family 2 protein [Planctomycetota bacterium]
MHLSIVIPAYNEQARLPATLEAAVRFLEGESYDSEIWVVDDGSADRTAAIAESVTSSIPVRVLRREHAGKGAAVRAGMLEATGTYRFLCDADLSMPFEELPRFLAEADRGADVIVGSRQVAGARRENERWYRHLMGRVFNGVVRLLTVRGIHDTQCGYKLFRGDLVGELFEPLSVEGFAFDVEVLFAAQRAGYRLVEIPIIWRQNELTRVSPVRHSIEMFGQVVRLRARAWAGCYPRRSRRLPEARRENS